MPLITVPQSFAEVFTVVALPIILKLLLRGFTPTRTPFCPVTFLMASDNCEVVISELKIFIT